MGARDELHGQDPGPPFPQPELFSLYEEARRGAAGPAVCRVWTARAGPAAHRGPDRRRRSWVTDARCSCAAGWWMCSSSSMHLCLLSSRLLKCPRSSSRTSLRDVWCVIRSWRNSWWTLLSFLCRVWRTSWWKCRRSCSHRPAVVLREYGSVRLVAAHWAFGGSTGGGVAPPTLSGPLHRGTPPR